eukprot:scaffold29297_cov101-Isochrysis_galbana.AAC.3
MLNIPALATTHLRGPQPPWSLISPKTCAQCATDRSERRSSGIHTTGPASGTLALIWSARVSAFSCERAASTTRPPVAAMAMAVVTPMPVVGPVTMVVPWCSSAHPSGKAACTSSQRVHLEKTDIVGEDQSEDRVIILGVGASYYSTGSRPIYWLNTP